MSSPWTTTNRPAGVTFVASITMIVAFLSMVRGFLMIAGQDSVLAEDLPGISATTYGWVELVFGVLTALVGIGLFRGAGWSRLLVTALMVVRMVAAFWAAVNANGLAWLLAAVLVGALALLVVLLLWNGRADAWFTRS
ncbi:MAG: hypothetical protein MUD13_07050 [Candidatus Nanopelagicales bacterium]|jgi:hypothetical protein|nr:hypothetical protein [Candidatus Nanopelagicales bacterium]